MEVTVFNFSGIYEEEDFYQGIGAKKVHLRDLSGCDCYCDEEAFAAIEGMLCRKNVTYQGLHFIDSGNYHYMTYLFLRQIQEPFSLLQLDHHPDTQMPGLIQTLSCGSWLGWALQELPMLRKVYMVGINPQLKSEVMEDSRIVTLYEDDGNIADTLARAMEADKNPLYITCDKDVLTERVAPVNWDNGSMDRDTLFRIFETAMGRAKNGQNILGIDVCGECAHDISCGNFTEMVTKNNEFNRALLKKITNVISYL